MPREYLTVPVERLQELFELRGGRLFNRVAHHFGRHDDLEFAELVAQEARRNLFGAFAPALN